MKLTKVSQTYLSILSVFLLAIVASGAYVFQAGNPISSSADVVSSQNIPQLIIQTDRPNYKVGDKIVVKISANTDVNPITATQLLFSYPPASLSLEKVNRSGIFGLYRKIQRNDLAGTVSIMYSPFLSYKGQGGQVTELTLKAKDPGTYNLTLLTSSQIKGIAPTSIATTKNLVTPLIKNATITVK